MVFLFFFNMHTCFLVNEEICKAEIYKTNFLGLLRRKILVFHYFRLRFASSFSKVGDLSQNKVFRLYVAMDNPLIVNRLKSRKLKLSKHEDLPFGLQLVK